MISNFYPIAFPMESFQIERLPYDAYNLPDLRAEHNTDNSFFRRHEFIYISPMGKVSVPGGMEATLSTDHDREIVTSLVRHIFFRTFKDNYSGIIPLDFYPFRILSRQPGHDLLARALIDLRIKKESLKGRLANKKLIEIQFRDITHEGKQLLGAIITIRYSWTYGDGVSCESFHSDGFNLVDRDVLHVSPLAGLTDVLLPEEKLIGTLSSISGNQATVETNEGSVSLPLSQLIPHRNRRNIDDLLSHYFGMERLDSIRKAIKAIDSSRLNAKVYQQEIDQMALTISKLEYRNSDNFTFNISSTPFSPREHFRLENPVFRFDYGPGATNSNASYGLQQHGPYDSLNFSPKKPRVAILCHGSSRDAFTSFLAKLRDGIPKASNFRGGMRGKYRLHDLSFDAITDFIEIKNYSGAEYERAVTTYLSQTDGDQRADIVFIQTKQEFKASKPCENPYYLAKSQLMMAGIPTQFIKTETIRKEDRFLKYTIDSIALQTYAKLGGVPYVLPAAPNVDREIIIGIGNAVIRSNAYSGNEQDRVVGITTFFKADGEYLFGKRCREVPYSDYFETLLKDLRSSLKELITGYGWREGDAVRIVFHVFKPMKKIEAEVVQKLVGEYPQYAITFAFVTITSRHPFILFDQSQNGVQRGTNMVGAYTPLRMANWILDEHSCLIQLSGVKEMASAYHGFSTPILIHIHEKSTFRDLHAISQQVFNFTFLSWRSFKPSREPITISYANSISELLTNLKKVKGWRPDVINSSGMRNKKWFL